MEETGRILVGCALKKEARALRPHLGAEVDLLVTGLGTDRTLRSLEAVFERRRPPALLFTGMAGQLDPVVELGQFLCPAIWRFESGTEFAVDSTLTEDLRLRGWEVEGAGVTVRAPVVKERERLRLFRETGARICDMESAAALMICRSYAVPCLAPKVVSDTAESGMLAFYRHFDHNIRILAERLPRLVSDLRDFLRGRATTST
jgi:nucleoside phosphorylase